MINVLITGANRGLGLRFVRSFLATDVNVICTTRNISGSKELLKCKKNSMILNYRVRLAKTTPKKPNLINCQISQ